MSPLIYQPAHETKYRVTWYPGCTQLRFEKYCLVATTSDFDRGYEWIDFDVRSFMEMPTSIKELYQEMEDYYHYGILMEQEYKQSLM